MKYEHTHCLAFCFYILKAIVANVILENTINIIHYNTQQGTTSMTMKT